MHCLVVQGWQHLVVSIDIAIKGKQSDK